MWVVCMYLNKWWSSESKSGYFDDEIIIYIELKSMLKYLCYTHASFLKWPDASFSDDMGLFCGTSFQASVL